MTLKIYGRQRSRALRALWAAAELGLEVDHIEDPSTAPEFQTVNPNNKIPAIDDDGFHLYESFAITIYLAKKYPGILLNSDLKSEALAMQWSFWAATELEARFLDALIAAGMLGGDKDQAAIDAIGEKTTAAMTVLNAKLSSQDYLLGDEFTVADLNVAAVVGWGSMAGIDFSAYPAMGAWLKRCSSRPAFPS